MTEHGIALMNGYTVTLLSAQEALTMTNWLLSHYVQLHQMIGEQARREKEEAKRGQ